MSTDNERDQRRIILKDAADLLNAQAVFLQTPDTSPQEDQAMALLDELMKKSYAHGEDYVTSMLACLTTMIVELVDSSEVQKWLDHYASWVERS
jgi:hypothetical protein